MEQEFEFNSKQINDGSFLNNSLSYFSCTLPVIRLWIKKVIEPKS